MFIDLQVVFDVSVLAVWCLSGVYLPELMFEHTQISVHDAETRVCAQCDRF